VDERVDCERIASRAPDRAAAVDFVNDERVRDSAFHWRIREAADTIGLRFLKDSSQSASVSREPTVNVLRMMSSGQITLQRFRESGRSPN
jgi:hypothetical protein